ncbi:hypothetical protein PENTCL1PPCAC_20135, partial [Pristionchus entomophagus]
TVVSCRSVQFFLLFPLLDWPHSRSLPRADAPLQNGRPTNYLLGESGIEDVADDVNAEGRLGDARRQNNL